MLSIVISCSRPNGRTTEGANMEDLEHDQTMFPGRVCQVSELFSCFHNLDIFYRVLAIR